MANRTVVYTDQHGRRFRASATEVRSDPNDTNALMYDRTGLMYPDGWSAPYPFWSHYPEYVETVQDDMGANHVLLNYDRFISETSDAHGEWQKRVDDLMRDAFGTEWKPGMAPTPQVIRKAGPAPRAWQPADAARRGNRYVLFGEGVCPEKLKPYFERKPQDGLPTLDEGEETLDIYADPQVSDVVEAAEDDADKSAHRAREAERKRKWRERTHAGAGASEEE